MATKRKKKKKTIKEKRKCFYLAFAYDMHRNGTEREKKDAKRGASALALMWDILAISTQFDDECS